MAGAPRGRGRKVRERESAAVSTLDRDVAPSPQSFALGGLCAVMVTVPLAVLDSPMGPFEDPKVWALPILVALTVLACLIGLGKAAGRTRAPSGRMTWLDAVVAAYALWWVVTTIAAPVPAQSLFGNFGRGLGLVALGSAIILFPLARVACGSPHAIRTLIDAMLLGSLPVCLLGIVQAMGWDPLPKTWDPYVESLTVRSTFGQHIFLGSYLVGIIPLALARLEWAVRERQSVGSERSHTRQRRIALAAAITWAVGGVGLVAVASRWQPGWWLLLPWGLLGTLVVVRAAAVHGERPWLPAPLVGGLLAGQVVVVVLSQARGPFLGMLAGVSVTAFALLARRRAWRTLVSVAALVLCVTTFIGLLNLPESPLRGLRDAPLLSRLSRLTELQRGTPGWFRLQVWRGTVDGWHRQISGETVIPGVSPKARSLVGYGLESQLSTLDRLARPELGTLKVRGDGWRGQYIVDRAHNVVLDHLVTGGVIGVALWALLVVSLIAAAGARARSAMTTGDRAVRLGALGTIVAHVVEGQVGIASTMPLAVFWVAAALGTLPSWPDPPVHRAVARPRRAWWLPATVAVALATVLVAWVQTRWLFGSIAYADGVKSLIAGQPGDAYASFQRSRALVPGLPLPAEAEAQIALRLAGAEPEPARRLTILREADATLAPFRGRATGATYWRLSGQVAFAQVRAGDHAKLDASLDAFARAAALRPGDGQILTQWAWALLEARDAERARLTAERALAVSPDGERWLAWAIVARAAREMGDVGRAEGAAARARSLAPPHAGRLLDSLI